MRRPRARACKATHWMPISRCRWSGSVWLSWSCESSSSTPPWKLRNRSRRISRQRTATTPRRQPIGARVHGRGAVAAAEAALQVEPGNSRRWNAFAGQLAADGQTSRAAGVLQQWVNNQEEDGQAWQTRHDAAADGRDTEALAAYEQSLRHAEPNPVILNNMAWLYLERDGKRAIELATQACSELAPHVPRSSIPTVALFRQGRKSEGWPPCSRP